MYFFLIASIRYSNYISSCFTYLCGNSGCSLPRAPNLEYYDYRVTDCAGPFVGFSQDGNCNYGVSVEGSLALDTNCEVYFNLTEMESLACQRLIEHAQRVLSLPNYCQELTDDGSDQKFINIQPIK